ncbi:hypothetical protein [Evtepia sp.]|uniref:hypothetical protein n=1 Tax=Evtepia sp. TaxID=2773933 RepID=UPI003F14CD61
MKTTRFLENLNKLVKQPEARLLSLTNEGNVLLQGKKDIIVPCHLTVCPRGIYAGVNGQLWTPDGQDNVFPRELGIITPKKILVRCDDPVHAGYLFDKDHPPKEGQVFIFFAWLQNLAEVFLVTPVMQNPFHLRWPSSAGPQFLGLCLDVLRSYDADASTNAETFFRAEGGLACGK